MKEYILKKYKKYNKNSVFGRGDEQRKNQNALQANADKIGEEFTRLTPPFSSDLKLSTAELSACDLISEGPIEGFVNANGESCSALEATFLDGTVVAEPLLSTKTIENLTTEKLSGVFYNFKPFVNDQLDSYAKQLQEKFVHKEYPISQSSLSSLASFGTIDYVKKVQTILACPGGRQILDSFMAWNHQDFSRLGNTTRDLVDSSMSSIRAGHGYRKVPFQYRRIYHANRPKPGSTYALPAGNYDYDDETNPIIYQGNYGFGNAINSSGRLERSYCTRAFFKTLHISTEKYPGTSSAGTKFGNFSRYLNEALSIGGSSFRDRFPRGAPNKYRYSLATNYEPEGLKEPLIDSLAEKVNNLGLDYWKPYRFYNSDPNVVGDLAVPEFFNLDILGTAAPYSADNPRYPSGLYNVFTPGSKSYQLSDENGNLLFNTNGSPKMAARFQRDKIFRRKAVIENKNADKFVARFGNTELSLTEYGTYSDDARNYKPNVTYRFTGSIYIPANNNSVNNVKFQLVDNDFKTVGSITGGTTEFPFDKWNDFDFEYANDNFRRLRIRMFRNNSNPGSNASGDFFALNNFAVLEKTTGNAPESSSDFAYMAFSADDFFGTNFNKDHELTFSVDGERLEIEDKNGLEYSCPEVTGFDLRSRNINESFVLRKHLIEPTPFSFERGKCSYYDGGYNRSQRFPIITGASNATSLGVELNEAESNKFKGAFLYPVYLGEKTVPLNSDGSVDTGKIFIDPSDSATISGNKIASGVSNDYDVFALKDGNFQYAHVANPNVKAPSVETLNKKIGLRLIEKDPGLFNFSNFKMDFNLGEENQKPLTQENLASTEFNKSIFGPSDSLQGSDVFDAEVNMDDGPNFGMRRYSAIEGTSSQDVGVASQENQTLDDLTFHSDWMANPPLDSDYVPLTYVVSRKDVDCIKITFIIEQLYQDLISQQDIYEASVKTDALQINFSVFTSFEGVPESIFPAEETKISYYGLVTTFYAVDSDEITLPSYDDIIDDYPNETKASLAQKFPRKVEVRKNDFETNSTRMGRAARIFQVIEVVKEKFSYPFSAVMKTYLDARTFKDPPNKQWNLRLRKIQIPSNYFPLDLGGRDKRFVDDAKNLGTRIVYDGDWDGTFKIGWTDNPAWILYDLLTDQRYGIGNRIDSFEDINIFNLYKIGRYCDAVDSNGVFVGLDNGLGGLEPRFSCNIMLDASNNGFESIKDIASVFNGMAFWANGRLDFFADQPKEVMMYFNNGNVFDGIFNYQTTSKSSLFNTADVVYLDKRDNYTAKKETIVDEDGLRKNGLLRRNVTAKGATSRSQATRLARYMIYSNKLEREVVNFKTSAQGLMLSIGDIIEVQDELKNFEANYAKILEKDFGDQTFAGQGQFQYFRFLGTNRDNTATTDKQAIKEIHLIDDAGEIFPTEDFDDGDLDDGNQGRTRGPYTQGGLTVTAGFSNSEPYGPHEAFGGSNIWWTLALGSADKGGTAADNHLTVDFGLAKDISQIKVQVSSSHHDCPKLRILASNDPSFNTFQVFGEIDNINILDQTELTVNAGQKITVFDFGSAGVSTSASSLTYSSPKSFTIENKINTNSVINNHSGAFVIVSTGQDKLVDLYNNVEAGGTIGTQELDNMYTPQVRKLKITGAAELTTKIRIGVEDPDGYFADVQTGTLINLDLQDRNPKQYRVLSINPEESNLYGISATEYRKEKFDIIESPINFTLDEAQPYNIGIPETENKTITEPLGFTSQVVSTQYNSKIDFEITGDGTGNETAYKLSVIHPNGKVDTKRIMKQGTIVDGNFVTTGTFNDVIAFGTHTFEVSSISSEEIFGGLDYVSLKQNYETLNASDSDNDGLSDFVEINTHGTDPNDSDSDDDGLEDAAEINTHGTDPLDSDTDDDGLSDADEIAGTTTQYGTQATDPLDADSDDDGLSDGDEVNTHDTNPLDTDSDDDTFDDALEVDAGSDPNDPNSLPGEFAAKKLTIRGSGTNGANGEWNFDNGGGSTPASDPHFWNAGSDIDAMGTATIGGQTIWNLGMGSSDDFDDFGNSKFLSWRSEQTTTEAPFPWRVRQWNFVGQGYFGQTLTGMPLITNVRMANNSPITAANFDFTTNVRSFDFTNNFGFNLATGKYVYSGIMNGAPLWGLSGATHDQPMKQAFHFYELNGSGHYQNRNAQDSSGVIVRFNGGVTEPLPWTVTSNGGQWSGIARAQGGDFLFDTAFQRPFTPQFTNFKDGDGNSVTP